MSIRQKIIGAAVGGLVGLFSCNASAFYASAVPPAAWSAAGTAATYATQGAAASAAAFERAFPGGFTGGTAAATVNAGGSTATRLPFAFRFASGAARSFAGFAFSNPLMMTMVLAPIAYNWFKDNGFTVVDGVWKKADPTVCSVDPCVEWSVRSGLYNSLWSGSVTIAAQNWALGASAASTAYSWSFVGCSSTCQFTRYGKGSLYPAGTDYIPPSSRTVAASPAVYNMIPTQSEFESAMGGKSLPDGIAQENAFPWPVDTPIINPDASIMPMPLRQPTGSPWPVPNSNPQSWSQPVSRITPANTPQLPWQVDITPEEVPSTNPTGMTSTATVTPTSPSGTTAPSPDLCALHPEASACKPALDLCKEHPEMSGCAKLDTPTGEIPKTTKNVTYAPESHFGGGGCPANVTFTPHGLPQMVLMDWSYACAKINSWVRPLVIAMGAWSALFILTGFKPNEG